MKLPVVGKAHEAQSGEPFHWFIYGSSLDRGAFAALGQEHGYRVPDFSRAVPARLDGFRLAFDVRSKFWGGATASLSEAPGESVEGIALPMPGDARGLVDHKEGAISRAVPAVRGERDAARRRRGDPGGGLSRGRRSASAGRRDAVEDASSRRWCAAGSRSGSATRIWRG